jgi:pimeloyl-ACP methyl ester carboxylesterase
LCRKILTGLPSNAACANFSHYPASRAAEGRLGDIEHKAGGWKMATFVLVPGGWHGAWYFQSFAEALRARGHCTHAITLTGLGERRHLLRADVNLDTHVQDVVQLLEMENLSEVILLGHSYAGMVVSGVLDLAPERIAAAIYCDAYVPVDGQSCFDLVNDFYRKLFIDNAAKDGFSVLPPPGLDSRTTPHPLATNVSERCRRGEHLIYPCGIT